MTKSCLRAPRGMDAARRPLDAGYAESAGACAGSGVGDGNRTHVSRPGFTPSIIQLPSATLPGAIDVCPRDCFRER
jgi:hypothetical protein